MNGKLIVFEGIDHVGKSTIASGVYEKLREFGLDCSLYSFPGKKEGTLGKLIYDIHHDNMDLISQPIEPLSIQILHVAAHVDVLSKHILPDIKNGKTVILDRFWWSTYAYGLGEKISAKVLKEIILPEQRVLNDINNILYIYITRKDRVQDYNDDKTRIILEAYEYLCANIKDGVLYRLKNNLKIEESIKLTEDVILRGIHE